MLARGTTEGVDNRFSEGGSLCYLTGHPIRGQAKVPAKTTSKGSGVAMVGAEPGYLGEECIAQVIPVPDRPPLVLNHHTFVLAHPHPDLTSRRNVASAAIGGLGVSGVLSRGLRGHVVCPPRGHPASALALPPSASFRDRGRGGPTCEFFWERRCGLTAPLQGVSSVTQGRRGHRVALSGRLLANSTSLTMSTRTTDQATVNEMGQELFQ